MRKKVRFFIITFLLQIVIMNQVSAATVSYENISEKEICLYEQIIQIA